jgi:hypothetical protein
LRGKYLANKHRLRQRVVSAKSLSLAACITITSAKLPDKVFSEIYPVFPIILPGEIIPLGRPFFGIFVNIFRLKMFFYRRRIPVSVIFIGGKPCTAISLHFEVAYNPVSFPKQQIRTIPVLKTVSASC